MNQTEKILPLYDKIPWLFAKPHCNIPPNDYILYLNKKMDITFLRYTCPDMYRITLLDDMRDNLIFTFPVDIPQGGLAFSALFGIDRETIIQVSPGIAKDGELVTSIICHCSIPNKYFEFLKNNMKYIFEPNKNTFGFAAHT
jgi:hypothetical protein